MKRSLNLSVFIVVLSFLMSCGNGGGDSNEKSESSGDGKSGSVMGTVEALKDAAKQAEDMQKNGAVETVDFRKLKEFLPSDADGLTRSEATGEKGGFGDVTISTARGRYGNEDGSQSITVEIVDTGGSGIMMGLAAWSLTEIDKETASGYEKTTKLGDYKAFEKYDNDRKYGEVSVLVNNRFTVKVNGNGVDIDKLKSTLEAVNLSELGELK